MFKVGLEIVNEIERIAKYAQQVLLYLGGYLNLSQFF